MTTSATLFLLHSSLLLTGALTVGTSAAGAQEDPRLIQLPTLERPAHRGPRAFFDGRHIAPLGDESPKSTLSLGPPLPLRSITFLIERRIDQAIDGRSGITVDALGSVLVLRGGTLGEGGSQPLARKVAIETLAEIDATLKSLQFDVDLRLLAIPAGGADPRAVISESRSIRSGERAAFGTRRQAAVTADFDVEVASAISIADPVIYSVQTGETVHLWTSTVMGDDGQRRLHVQGLLDLAHVGESRSFDPDIYELGTLQQPTVNAVQIAFSGTIEPGVPLVVEVAGLVTEGGEEPDRRLEISATRTHPTAAAETGSAGEDRVLDLARGMWREATVQRHVLVDERVSLSPLRSQSPAAAAQLLQSLDDPGSPRPEVGSSILLFGSAAKAAQARALLAPFDPAGPSVTWVLESSDGFRASVPTSPGSTLRVVRSHETNLVVDYDPQIANDASLADPIVATPVTGSLLEAVMEESTGLRGVLDVIETESIEVRKSDTEGAGRIQEPATARTSTPFRFRSDAMSTIASPSETVHRAAGWTFRLTRR